VTLNLKHFPTAELQKWNLQAREPDEFCLDLAHQDPVTMHTVITEIADACRNPRSPPARSSTGSKPKASDRPPPSCDADAAVP
jgi:hypothetical protein